MRDEKKAGTCAHRHSAHPAATRAVPLACAASLRTPKVGGGKVPKGVPAFDDEREARTRRPLPSFSRSAPPADRPRRTRRSDHKSNQRQRRDAGGGGGGRGRSMDVRAAQPPFPASSRAHRPFQRRRPPTRRLRSGPPEGREVGSRRRRIGDSCDGLLERRLGATPSVPRPPPLPFFISRAPPFPAVPPAPHHLRSASAGRRRRRKPKEKEKRLLQRLRDDGRERRRAHRDHHPLSFPSPPTHLILTGPSGKTPPPPHPRGECRYPRTGPGRASSAALKSPARCR